MATYQFATITPAEALAATTADDIIVGGTASASQVTVSYVPPVATGDAITPATIQVTIAGKTVAFGTNITGANNVFVFGDGSQLYIGNQNSAGGENGATNAGSDALFGLAGNDTLNGGAGNDLLQGNQGNDSLTGGTGADTIYGGQGDDIVVNTTGDTSSNFVNGNLGDDILRAGQGTDTLLGGQNDDRIYGNALAAGGYFSGDLGNDSIYGSAASESILGGAGDDLLFAFNADADRDNVLDVTTTGALDTLLVVQNAGEPTVSFASGVDSIDGGAGNDIIVLGAGASSALGGAGNDTIVGGTGNSTLDGGEGNDTLIGVTNPDPDISGGNELLIGGAGNDTIFGGEGRDTLQGGDGTDVLRGGRGQDVLTGGAGSDTYVFDTTDTVPPVSGTDVDTLVGNADVVTDWTFADRLDFNLSAGDEDNYFEILQQGINDYGDALDAALDAVDDDPALLYVAVQLGANVLVFSHYDDLDGAGPGTVFGFQTVVQLNNVTLANINETNFVA